MVGFPRIPGLHELIQMLQAQTEAMAQLPRTLVDLNRSILSLVDVVQSAKDTLASTQRVTARLEGVVEQLEEPVLALKPGMHKLSELLQDPAVDTIPDTLRKINEEVLPLVQGVRDTQTKVNNIASIVEETSGRIAGIPGASLLLGRRGRAMAEQSGESAAADSKGSADSKASTDSKAPADSKVKDTPQNAGSQD